MKKHAGLGRRGFTLIEVIVVAAIIAILAAILVPMIFNQVDDSKITKAKGDIKSIATAMDLFRTNTGLPPNRTNGTDPTTNTLQVLASEGNPIADLATKGWDGQSNQLVNLLRINDNSYPATGPTAWKGPYLPDAPADPWGNRYYVGVKNIENSAAPAAGGASPPVWIISAGPNGIIDTAIDSQVCFDGVSLDPATGAATLSSTGKPADDICFRYK